MSTTTVFESPTALGAKIITISTTITNTSGAYTATISDERLTVSMKAIKLELGDPSVFDAVINVAVNNGSLTISCASVTGTSTAVISVLKTCDDPTAITTTEFDVLANRIGDLDDLETTAKTDLVSAVNEVADKIADFGADWDNAVSVTSLNSAGGEFTAPSNGFLRVLCVKQNDTNESVYYLRYGASDGLYAMRYRDLGGSQYTYTTTVIPLKKGQKVVVDTATNMYGLSNTGANGTVCFVPYV